MRPTKQTQTVTLGVSALELLHPKARQAHRLPLNIGGPAGKWHRQVRTGQYCSGTLWGSTSNTVVSSLIAIWRVYLMAWPVCFSLNLVCWGTSLQLLRHPAASNHLFSNTLLPSLWGHVTLICLKTAWLLLFQENSHVLALSHLFHLLAAWFFSFCYTNNQGLFLCSAFRSESRPVSTRPALSLLRPSIPTPPVCVCRGCGGSSKIARDELSYLPKMGAGALWVSGRFLFREGRC